MGENLKKALMWFEKAVQYEQEGKSKQFIDKALGLAIDNEKKGIAAGEKW